MCLDAAAESLYDYLAGAREYLDLVADQSEIGMKIVAGQQSYSARANWKLLVENSYDGYRWAAHPSALFRISHRDRHRFQSPHRALGPKDRQAVDLGNGHAVVESVAPWGRPIARWVPPFGEERKPHFEAVRRRFDDRFGPERGWRICETSRNLGNFPEPL